MIDKIGSVRYDLACKNFAYFAMDEFPKGKFYPFAG